MDSAASAPIDLPGRPAVASEYALSADTLRRRGAVLAGEALADWPLLQPAGRALALSGLAGTLVTLDGLRLAPAADGGVDLSLLALPWLAGARVSAGPAGAAQGAGALAGAIDLELAPAAAGPAAWAIAGVQGQRGIAGLDLRLGDAGGWIGGGFTQGGAVPVAGGLAATGQGRWHLGGRFARDLGGVQIWGRALLASRHDGAARADWHDVAAGLAGGSRWQWRLALATGGHDAGGARSRLGQARAMLGGATGIILPGAAEPISLGVGAEWRRLRLAGARVAARELFAQAALPLLQDRPAAENLVATLGLRQVWIGGRRDTLWQVGGRWEFFPGIALRGQLARGIDDLATTSGIGRSIGLIATPAFVPGLSLTVDWRSQAAGPARVRGLDIAAGWRGRVGAQTQLAVAAQATRLVQADATAQPVPAFASLVRATLERGPWALSAGWRHRSTVAAAGAGTRLDGVDLAVERQLGERIRLVASIGNAGDAGSAAAPVWRQALLQLVAGF